MSNGLTVSCYCRVLARFVRKFVDALPGGIGGITSTIVPLAANQSPAILPTICAPIPSVAPVIGGLIAAPAVGVAAKVALATMGPLYVFDVVFSWLEDAGFIEKL